MKLENKTFLAIGFILISIFVVLFSFNNYFFERYFLYEKKKVLENAKDSYLKKNKLDETIILVKTSASSSEEIFNENILYELSKVKIKPNRFWINKVDLKKIEKGTEFNRIYNQGVMGTSILVKIFREDEQFVLLCTSVPHIDDSLKLQNKFVFFLLFLGILIALIVIRIFIAKILMPISELNNAAKKMENMELTNLSIETGDEIEDLANSFSKMSLRVHEMYEQLDKKNKELSELTNNLAHELKTPVTLIKSYAIGIKDGYDDGSFLEEVIVQSDNLNTKINDMLIFSKLSKVNVKKEKLSVVKVMNDVIQEFRVAFEKIDETITDDIEVFMNKEQLKSLFRNIFINALKYSSDKKIEIELSGKTLRISNKSSFEYENIEDLWKAFVVGEKSRNKELSGTGLGLSIVKSIMDSEGYNCRISGENGVFSIFLEF